jgi:hypothetical protein
LKQLTKKKEGIMKKVLLIATLLVVGVACNKKTETTTEAAPATTEAAPAADAAAAPAADAAAAPAADAAAPAAPAEAAPAHN